LEKQESLEYVSLDLKQAIDGERHAISDYNEILKFIGDKDSVTCKMIESILSDEVEHEEDLEMLLKDLS